MFINMSEDSIPTDKPERQEAMYIPECVRYFLLSSQEGDIKNIRVERQYSILTWIFISLYQVRAYSLLTVMVSSAALFNMLNSDLSISYNDNSISERYNFWGNTFVTRIERLVGCINMKGVSEGFPDNLAATV